MLAREGGVFVDPARRARGAPGRLARNDASLPLHFTTPSIQITEAGTTMAVSTASGADVTPLVRALGNIPGWTLQPTQRSASATGNQAARIIFRLTPAPPRTPSNPAAPPAP